MALLMSNNSRILYTMSIEEIKKEFSTVGMDLSMADDKIRIRYDNIISEHGSLTKWMESMKKINDNIGDADKEFV